MFIHEQSISKLLASKHGSEVHVFGRSLACKDLCGNCSFVSRKCLDPSD